PDGYGLQTFALCIPACSAHLSSANTSFVFFVQAEDGIRDRNVTGVQTCALPICRSLSWSRPFITLSRSRPLLSRGMLGCRRATGLLRRVSFANTPMNVMGRRSRAKSSLLAESVMTWPAPGTRSTAHREGRQPNGKRFLAMYPHSIFQPSHAPALPHPVWGSEATVMSDYNIGPDEI